MWKIDVHYKLDNIRLMHKHRRFESWKCENEYQMSLVSTLIHPHFLSYFNSSSVFCHPASRHILNLVECHNIQNHNALRFKHKIRMQNAISYGLILYRIKNVLRNSCSGINGLNGFPFNIRWKAALTHTHTHEHIHACDIFNSPYNFIVKCISLVAALCFVVC